MTSERMPALTLDQSTRGWADVLALWRLCRNAACVRASGCRGEANTCFRAHLPLLPESVQAWFEHIGAAQEDGLSYDEAIAELAGTVAERALERWHEAIADSRLTAARRPHPNRI
jgi:hypothetical protein